MGVKEEYHTPHHQLKLYILLFNFFHDIFFTLHTIANDHETMCVTLDFVLWEFYGLLNDEIN